MLKVYDVRCPKCGAVEEDELLEPDEEPSGCPSCGSKRNIIPFGATQNDLTFALFRPLDLGYGKVLNTKEELDAYMADQRRLDPDVVLDFSGWDKNEAKRNAEERRHAAWERRKAKGISDADLRDLAKMPNGRRVA